MIQELKREEQQKLNKQIDYWSKYIKKKIKHIDIDEARSEIVYFVYNRKNKYNPEKAASYITYLINLVKYGALNFLKINQKISSFEYNISLCESVFSAVIYLLLIICKNKVKFNK